MQTTQGSSYRLGSLQRLDDRTRLVGADEAKETFKKNAE
jgi:hypothetical protein